MGKKRVSFIGDVSAEEVARQKKEEKRAQKALREEGKLTEKQEKVKEKAEEVVKTKISGLKGGQRVVDTAGKAMEEMEVQKQKEAELAKLRAEVAGKTGEEAGGKQARARSSRYKVAKIKVESGKAYPVAEAVKLVREIKLSKFDETVELHLNLVKEGLKLSVELPYSTGRSRKVAVADEATVEKIKAGKIDFDVLLATPEQMPKLVVLAKTLGPKGLMPNPKNGTVVKNLEEGKKKFAGNGIEIRSEKKAPLAHLVVGKLSMKDEELAGNIQAVLEAVTEKNLQKVVIKSTMSPAVRVAVG